MGTQLVPRGSSREGGRVGHLIKNPKSEVLGKEEKRSKSFVVWVFFPPM